jgi:hypothetical protein
MSEQSNEELRARLEQAVVRDRDLDREIAGDWRAVDRETGQQLDRRESATRCAKKSTSPRSTRR